MNLYLISQNDNRGYDTYDSAVVAAESEAQARAIHPNGSVLTRANMDKDIWEERDYYKQVWKPVHECSNDWSSQPSRVSVTLIGTAVDGTSAGVICASFNAG